MDTIKVAECSKGKVRAAKRWRIARREVENRAGVVTAGPARYAGSQRMGDAALKPQCDLFRPAQTVVCRCWRSGKVSGLEGAFALTSRTRVRVVGEAIVRSGSRPQY